jgi:hypothetical protein
MDGTMSDRPAIKKASPHDVKKAFGANAQRVLEVIDSHADCLEGLIAQVEALTVAVHALQVAAEHANYERDNAPRIVLPS